MFPGKKMTSLITFPVAIQYYYILINALNSPMKHIVSVEIAICFIVQKNFIFYFVD